MRAQPPAPARPPRRLTQGAVAADVEDWWGELLGPKLAFDYEKYMVICLNVLGSCYVHNAEDFLSSRSPVGIPEQARLSVTATARSVKTRVTALTAAAEFAPRS